ncbi:MAG: glycosyltransferase family 2 protein [Candidatus Korarchaeum sp.]|nr:glycosyltransferase family 2 protein [Candidatus Korarchaeum sp.]MDW8036308.1 glycosyltransferase family 2 protein [Candidatus Korarchaeum sp.]
MRIEDSPHGLRCVCIRTAMGLLYILLLLGLLMKAALIPAYNEESRIAPVILKARRHVDLVIVCDDGSTDLTSEVARSLGAYVIKHERNMGYGAALLTLFKEALEVNVSIAVTLDADGQHDPDLIPALIKPIEEGIADLVIGSRFVSGGRTPGISPFRKLALRLLNILGRRATGLKVADTQSGMRAYSRRALEVAQGAVERGMGVSLGILKEASSSGLRVIEVPAVVSYVNSKSSKNPVTHFSELIATILRIVLEERPLAYLGVPGAILLAVSIHFGLWAANLYLSTNYFSLPMVFISLTSLLLGILLIVASFQLYSIARIRAEIRKLRRAD